jgi:hypothetical protein
MLGTGARQDFRGSPVYGARAACVSSSTL